jgi:hypothetical protein
MMFIPQLIVGIAQSITFSGERRLAETDLPTMVLTALRLTKTGVQAC